jgi:hypothetical protein
VENRLSPVVVFQGINELEAQIARDVLAAAMIPVLHLPSVSTGIFGVRSTVKVAVPEEYAEQAVEVIQEAGLEAISSRAPGGMAAIEDAVREKIVRLPGEPMRLPENSWLRRVLVVLAILIAILVAITVFRS